MSQCELQMASMETGLNGIRWEEIVNGENEVVQNNLKSLLKNIEELDKSYLDEKEIKFKKKNNEKFLLDLLEEFDAFKTGIAILLYILPSILSTFGAKLYFFKYQ